jgi:hypothetical protein
MKTRYIPQRVFTREVFSGNPLNFCLHRLQCVAAWSHKNREKFLGAAADFTTYCIQFNKQPER